jgi:hypothetical protein
MDARWKSDVNDLYGQVVHLTNISLHREAK